jgi:hypothetical protein
MQMMSVSIYIDIYYADDEIYTMYVQVLCSAHMQAFMFNVQLPTNSTAVAAALQQRLDVDYDTYIVVVTLGDIVYTRLSAQVGGKGERE